MCGTWNGSGQGSGVKGERKTMRTFWLVTTLVLSLASSAAAQKSDDGVQRNGFLFGFAIGGGQLSCDGCESKSGPAVDLHLGAMVSDKMALMFDGSGIAISDEFSDSMTSVVDTLAIQYWVANKVWLKGGVGFGTLSCEDCETETGLGFMGAAGVELLQKGKFALDVQARFATAKYDGGRINQFTAMVGANWY
jgi:hypothetical protein